MKKLAYVLVAFTLVVSSTFVSCDKVTDLLEITLRDVTFEAEINVTELTTKDGGYEFGGSGSIEPSENSALSQYLALIRNVEITEIKVTVNSVTPATGLDLYDATFSITDDETGANFTHTITTTTPIIVGTEFVLDSSLPNFGVVSDIINDLHDATIAMGGHVSETGFALGFTYSIKADITVGVPEDD